ncbi:hypothetical protein [Novosphingobium sp. BL-8A]|uniref:hypothetical protein n=1 Tax=Novosphingobium sp. BL-8A TaxID=3127639 RepID=UPI003756307A
MEVAQAAHFSRTAQPTRCLILYNELPTYFGRTAMPAPLKPRALLPPRKYGRPHGRKEWK